MKEEMFYYSSLIFMVIAEIIYLFLLKRYYNERSTKQLVAILSICFIMQSFAIIMISYHFYEFSNYLIGAFGMYKDQLMIDDSIKIKEFINNFLIIPVIVVADYLLVVFIYFKNRKQINY